MKKTIKLVGTLFMAVLLCVNFTACGGDDDDDVVKPDVPKETDVTITIGEDGSVTKGHIFVAVDDKTFFLDYVKYSIVDSHLEVTGHDSQLSGNIDIPSAIKYKSVNLNVIAIANAAFKNCSNLTGVSIPNSVTYIGEKTFQGCSSLKSITFPRSVTKIGWSAFEGCSSLTSLTIPNSVTKIGDEAFSGCSNVKELIYEEGCTTTLRTYLTSIEKVIIPNSVTSIGNYAFAYCSGLTSVIIPSGVTTIYAGAFYHCSSLTSLTIPKCVTNIEGDAFSGCSNLTSVTNLADKPQTINYTTFSIYGTLHVKSGCTEEYKAADFWNKFTIVDDAKE